MDIDPEEFVNKFSPDLMEITYAWSKGVRGLARARKECCDVRF